jgi:hypothetical protein
VCIQRRSPWRTVHRHRAPTQGPACAGTHHFLEQGPAPRFPGLIVRSQVSGGDPGGPGGRNPQSRTYTARACRTIGRSIPARARRASASEVEKP